MKTKTVVTALIAVVCVAALLFAAHTFDLLGLVRSVHGG